MSVATLETVSQAEALESFYDRPDEDVLQDPDFALHHERLLIGLESGELRAARPAPEAELGWRAEGWIKRAILLGFRAWPTEAVGTSATEAVGTSATAVRDSGPSAFDRPAYLPRHFTITDGVRLVPGGSAVRRGAYVSSGVVIMPPAYVNVGAYVGAGTMVDSHALVGSCAQIGTDVHLSAGAQIGGVLEPPGARPVVIEDGAFIGGQCGVFEGFVVGRRAVLAPGVQLTAATEIFDLVRERTWRDQVPEGAVVVPGSRPARGDFATAHGLALYAPVIVKYRDPGTDVSTALEEALR